jgi:hypothetical protein
MAKSALNRPGHTMHGWTRGMTRLEEMLHLADRLGQIERGSAGADLSLHLALDLEGDVMPYTRQPALAFELLPRPYAWLPARRSDERIYMACRRLDGAMLHRQWARTLPLAMCGALLRAHAALASEA